MNPSSQTIEEARRIVLVLALLGLICCTCGGAVLYSTHARSQEEGGQVVAPPPKGPIDEFFRGFHGPAFLMIGLGFGLFVSAVYFDRRAGTPKRGFFVDRKFAARGPRSLRLR